MKILSFDKKLILLFSDGYSDQFSDKTDKKITIKRLRQLLIETASLAFEEQKEYMLRFFENWKGSKEQTDDVLLMCIQIPKFHE